MKRKLCMFLTLFFMGMGIVMAQTQVRGTVVDENGEPVIGATIQVKGTMQGTVTDANGSFNLSAPAGGTLVVSYVGYSTQEVPVSANVRVALAADMELLDEVVVTGYSTTTRRSFTGSAKVVDAKEISKKSVSNVSQVLAGEAPGIQVINTSGQPGSTSDIYVRGIGSINGSVAPLYVVDGMPYSGGITTINPNDIESITLLKDASATAIYGARGANGVIVVTTKQGKRDMLQVDVEQKVGANTRFLPRYDVIRSPEEYLGVTWQGLKQRAINSNETNPEAWANDNLFLTGGSGIGIPTMYNIWKEKNVGQLIDPTTGTVRPGIERIYSPENWADYAFQPSLRSETNISITGGTPKSSYYTSVGYLKDQGYSIKSDYQRFTVRANINANPTTWFNTGINLGYSLSETIAGGQSSYSSTNLFTFIDDIPPLFPVFLRDDKGEKVPDPYYGGYQYDWGDKGRPYSTGTNAVATAMYDHDSGVNNNVNLNLFANLRFLKYFTLENKFAGAFGNTKYIYRGDQFYGPEVGSQGTIYHSHSYRYTWTLLNLLRFSHQFNDHNIEAFGAHEASSFAQAVDMISKKKLVNPFGNELSNALEMTSPASGYDYGYTLESYLAQINYDYLSKYYLSLTGRRDGASRFKNQKWGNFASVGLAWMLSSESFMESVDWLKTLKLKTSYGSLGQQTAPSRYLYYSGEDLYSISPLDGKPSFSLSTKGNPNLTWEKSNMFQLGVEFNIANKVDGSIDYYVKRTIDMLFDRRVAPSNGYSIIQENAGELLNRGLEFDLTGHIIRTRDAYFDVKLNGSWMKNKITHMPIDPSTGKEKILDTSLSGYGRAAGYSVYDHYIRNFLGVNAETGLSEYTQYYTDNNNNDVFDKGDTAIESLVLYKINNPDKIGEIKEGKTTNYVKATQYFNGKSALPVLRGAVGFAAGYKGFDLSMQFIYSLGGYSQDFMYAGFMNNQAPGKENWHKDIHKRWMKEGDITDIPRMNSGLDENTTSRSSRFLTSMSFLNLNNVRFGYTFSNSMVEKIQLKGLSLWLSGDNVFLLTARKGFNPSTSISGSTSGYTYSPLTTFTAGVRVSF